jgi:cytochrome c6
MRKSLAAVLTVAVMMLVTFVVFTSRATGTPAPGGADLFKAKCAMCHGGDGSGSTTMGKKLGCRDLRSAAVQGQSDSQLTQIIANGKNKMPAYNGKLSGEEIKSLVAFIRSIKQ